MREFDEIYIKDEKKIHFHSLDKASQEMNFNNEIEKLKPEIQMLPEGKHFPYFFLAET